MSKPVIQAVYKTPRALSQLIRVSNPEAIRYVVSVLQKQKGNVSSTLAELGFKDWRTWYDWGNASQVFKDAVAPHAMGREGAMKKATKTRMKQEKEARAAARKRRRAGASE